MKAIMVMFDSLNRRMLEPYGCNWVHTPNFSRLAENSITFENSYVGSMPCMPARRDLHTGRYNFLHRSWGPIEPFDDSMPEILKNHGIYTHLVTDHYHYWEDGGATYHTRYSSFEFSRGQEGDRWKGNAKGPNIPETVNNTGKLKPNWISRDYIQKNENRHYQYVTFNNGLEFLENNYLNDNWFLQIETFDPHEPYFTPQKYKDLYPHKYDGPVFDWPPYRTVKESDEEINHVRYECAALHTMCDESLGRILDFMDKHNMWDDTLLIVNTDHGFLLNEHSCWAKCWTPMYDEISHTPLFIWDPRSKQKNIRNSHLVQTIDLAPTLLDFFNINLPKDMQGIPLKDTLASNCPTRDYAIFGLFGGQVNCTDGRYVYMRAPISNENEPLYEYTLMPTTLRGERAFIREPELRTIELQEPFKFTKGMKLMKMKANEGLANCMPNYQRQIQFGTLLFDLKEDPYQQNPISNPIIENKMTKEMIKIMKENDAPEEQFIRLGLK